MKERTFSTNLMKRIAKDLRGSKTIKHSDRATTGVPDLSTSWMGYTHWVEDKCLRVGRTLKEIVAHLQVITCHELSVTTNGRCWIVVYEETPRRTVIWQPRTLAAKLWPKIVLGEPTGDAGESYAQSAVEDVNFDTWIRREGVIRFDGWQHGAVTKLIRDAACRA